VPEGFSVRHLPTLRLLLYPPLAGSPNGIDLWFFWRRSLSQQEASGPPWIVALTERYNVSYPIRLHNFAWAGATIDEDLVVPYTSTVQSLKSTSSSRSIKRNNAPLADQASSSIFADQVATFHSTESEWDPEKTLFTFYFGINDVGNTYDWTNVSLSDFYQQEIGLSSLLPCLPRHLSFFFPPFVVSRSWFFPLAQPSDTYHSLLSELASSGASNFLLLNVPPTDRTPMFIEMGPTSVSAVQSAIHIFNEKLSGMVENFRKNIEKKGGYVGFFDDGEVFAVCLLLPFSLLL
jgi:phospholipase/lecithinase/hemolysin